MKKADNTRQNTVEYEKVIHDQRKRIVELRDENTELKNSITRLEQNQAKITCALAAIEHSREQIIESARSKAECILREAEEKRRHSELSVTYYSTSLKDLEKRCERILDSINRELCGADPSRLRLVK